MPTNSQDTFHIQENAKEQDTHSKNSISQWNESLPGTPFHITGNKEKGYFLRMGDYRLTEIHQHNEIEKEFSHKENIKFEEKLIIYFADMLLTEQYNITLTMIAAALHKEGSKNVKIS